MADCKTLIVLVAVVNLVVSAVPGISVSDLEHRITVLESNMADYKAEAQKQATLTSSLLAELSKSTQYRQRLEQTISQLQTQIQSMEQQYQSQDQHYQGVVADLLSKAALTEDKLVNLTKDYDQLALTCISSLAEVTVVIEQVYEMKSHANNQEKVLSDLKRKLNDSETYSNNLNIDLTDLKTKATSTDDKLANLSTTSSTLQVKVNNLQAKGHRNEASISTLASKVDLADKEIALLSTDYRSLSQAHAASQFDLTKMKKDLVFNVTELSISLAQSTEQRRVLMTEVSDLQKVVNGIRSNRQKVVAFTSAIRKSTTVHKNDNVLFDNVLLNIGNHYNLKTGIFTCPYSGVYVLHLHAMGHKDKTFQLHVMRGYDTSGVFSGDVAPGFHHASNSDVVYLKVGDQVVVKSLMESYLYEWYTSFSGFLLHAD